MKDFLNDNLVAALASLFNEKPEVIKDETKLEGVITKFKEGHQIFTSEELTKKIQNAQREAVDSLGKDGQALPSHIYNLAKGNAFEKAEKEIAKKYGVEKWDGLDDLVARVALKETENSGKAVDEALKLKDRDISDLKTKLKSAIEEKDSVVKAKQTEFDMRIIGMEVDRAVFGLPIDAEGEKLTNNQEMLKTMYQANYKHEMVDGKIVVSDKSGNILRDKVGDPRSVPDVLTEFANKWVTLKGAPEGGRGGSSTTKPLQGLAGLNTLKDVISYAEKNSIKPGSWAFTELMMKVKEANPDANLD